jgi:hypothetical protein
MFPGIRLLAQFGPSTFHSRSFNFSCFEFSGYDLISFSFAASEMERALDSLGGGGGSRVINAHCVQFDTLLTCLKW